MSDPREFFRTPDWPVITTPLDGTETVEIWQDGVQRQGPLSVLGGVPAAHHVSHQDGGTDEIATYTPSANAIPKADSSGTLSAWIPDGTTATKGKVLFAADGEVGGNKSVQANDARLSNARTPTAHNTTHITGSDIIPNATDVNPGLLSSAMKIKVDSVTPENIPTADQKGALAGSTGTPSASNPYLTEVEKGAASGLCPLNASSQVDSGYLPSYVDDVIEVANYAALPVTGEYGKIYVTLDTNLTYRWSGSAYVEISKSLALGETSSTAYRGDRGKTAYDHSQVTGNPHGTTIADISTLTGKITPISDISRVMQINGDGIPQFPDNVAGATLLRNKDWTVTTGWTGASGVTMSIESSMLKVVPTSAGFVNIYQTNSAFQNKVIRCIIKSSIPLTNVTTIIGSTVYTQMRLESLGANKYIADIYWSRIGLDAFHIWPDYGLSTLPTWYLEAIYIGSGLYDTPVYDKACCNRFTNNGVLPVKGNRGLALSFNGAQSLVGDNPVIGTSGTIAFWVKPTKIPVVFDYIMSNNNIGGGISGIQVGLSQYNILRFGVSNGVTTGYGTKTLTQSVWNAVVITYNSSAIIFNIDGVDVETITSPQVPALAAAVLTIGSSFNGELSHIEYHTDIWTLAQKQRFANGEDAIDSQQKAITPVAHSIMTRKSDGRTEVATGTASLDATNKGQMDTAISAALAGILYETYTAADTFTSKQLGYLGSDGKMHLFDASAEATAKGALYIADSAVTATNSGTFQRMGEVTTTGLTAGATYYGSETAGGYTTTAPTTSGAIVRIIGYAQSTTVLFFNPSNDYAVLV